MIVKKNYKDAKSIFQRRFHGRHRYRIVRSLISQFALETQGLFGVDLFASINNSGKPICSSVF